MLLLLLPQPLLLVLLAHAMLRVQMTSLSAQLIYIQKKKPFSQREKNRKDERFFQERIFGALKN